MPYNSSTREAVCLSSELIDFEAAACSPGVPSGRIADEMVRAFVSKSCVMVWIALGVGGANPPVIPVKTIVDYKDVPVIMGSMYHSEVLTNTPRQAWWLELEIR